MMRGLLLLIVCVLVLPSVCYPKARFAERGQGIRLNQTYIRMENGHLFAVHNNRAFLPETILPQEEAEWSRRQARYDLDRHRYWNGGVPPRGTVLERFQKDQYRKELRRLFRSENWFRKGFTSKPTAPPKGG